MQARRKDYLRRSFVRARAKEGAKWVTQEKSRIEERKVRAGVSKRVAKCNLKKERTSSLTTTLSSPLTATPPPLPPRSHPRATTRRKKAKSSVWFTIQPAYSQPTLCLPTLLSQHRHLLFSLFLVRLLHSSPFLFDFAYSPFRVCLTRVAI